MNGPFVKIDTGMLLGKTIDTFSCIQCGEAPQTFLAAAMGDPENKPNIMWAYALCGRCSSMYWEEAGEKFMQAVRDVVCK